MSDNGIENENISKLAPESAKPKGARKAAKKAAKKAARAKRPPPTESTVLTRRPK